MRSIIQQLSSAAEFEKEKINKLHFSSLDRKAVECSDESFDVKIINRVVRRASEWKSVKLQVVGKVIK